MCLTVVIQVISSLDGYGTCGLLCSTTLLLLPVRCLIACWFQPLAMHWSAIDIVLKIDAYTSLTRC